MNIRVFFLSHGVYYYYTTAVERVIMEGTTPTVLFESLNTGFMCIRCRSGLYLMQVVKRCASAPKSVELRPAHLSPDGGEKTFLGRFWYL